MKTKIQVTEKHINLGEQECPNYCAIALAIREVCKDGTAVEVDPEGIEIDWHSRKVPAKVADFIMDFDNDRDLCEPFSFVLDIPKDSLEKI